MSRLGRALGAIGSRLRRVRPDRVPGQYLGWIIACWILTLVAIVGILVPGTTDGIVAQQAGSSALIGLFAAPLLVRTFILLAAAVLAGSLVIRQRLGEVPPLARELGLVAAGAFPVLALLADRQWIFAAAAIVAFAAAEVVAHRPSSSGGGGVIVALLVAAAWLVLLAAQFASADAATSWTWIALFGFAAAFAAFGSYYGVARAAESRSKGLQPLFRDDLPTPAVVGVVVAIVVLTVLRLTVARELFPEPDPALWSPLATVPLSWLHAGVVAAVVVALAARSVRRPRRRSHERRVTAALAIAGNADLAAGVGVILVGMVVAAASGEFFAPGIPPVVVALLKFAGVVAITTVALVPRFRGTAARSLALITGVNLVPFTFHGLLVRAGVELPDGIAGFPATPVQVAVLLLVVAVVGATLPAVRRAFGSGLVVRLAVVPFVAVHAGWLLPAAWSDLGRVVLVVGVVLALLFLLPKPAPDRDLHARDLLTASSGQLLVLVVFALALPSFFDDPQLVVLGLFWLSLAVIGALTVRTTGDREPVEAA